MSFLLLLAASSALAQTSSTDGATPPPTAPRPRESGLGACWQRAGVSQTTMEQVRSIERDAHARVEVLHNNLSLSPRERQFQMREIRQQARAKVDALTTPEQQSSLRACRQERSGTQH